MKRTEWRKSIDHFGISIEAKPSKVGRNNVHVVNIGSIPRTSYGNPPISSHHLDKYSNLESTKLRLYQLTKKLAVEITPHISYALRYLGVIFEKYTF